MRVERAAGRIGSHSGRTVLGWCALIAVAASAYVSLAVAPTDAEQGDVQRLMYVHVPAAWLAYLSFAVVFAASIAYVRTERSRWDRIAAASAEIGVLFTGLTIVLGATWGKPVWGTWWTWDPRLTTTAVLFLIYVGYLSIRRVPEDPAKRGRWAAVVGIVGFVDVPIVHLSVVWWRSLHQGPSVIRADGPSLAPSMLWSLLIGVVAFSILYAYLLTLRLWVGRLDERVRTERLSNLITGDRS